ncbi:hypothetical protein DRQ32_08795 [bacterium]|nr:MAG: hypothetical protein DRQ32_08795 [bacterium]
MIETRILPSGGFGWAVVVLVTILAGLVGCIDQENRPGDGVIPAAPILDDVHRILLLDDRLARVEELAGLLRTIPETEETARVVIAAYRSSFLDRGDIELVLIVEWWIRFDANNALAWTRGSWRADHPRLAYAASRALARQDPQAAVDAYHSFKGGRFPNYAVTLQPIIVGWFESGRPDLMRFILSLPENNLRQQALGTLARLQVLKLGPEMAIQWADQSVQGQSETFTRHMRQRIAASIAELEPRVAAEWVRQLVEDGASETLLRRVAGRWSRQDAPAAFAWLSEFEPSSHQRQAVTLTFAGWYVREPDEAERWLLSQEGAIYTTLAPATVELMKARAERSLVEPEFDPDWEKSLEVALKIEDPDRRWTAVLFLSRAWVQRDSAVANAWMESNGVPEMYRQKANLTPRRPAKGSRPRDDA